jgi:Protein of unknown function DUF262
MIIPMIIPEPAPPLVKPEITLIEDLFREIEAGKLRIPHFQRPFVWRPENMLSLFDSIRKGYPIGSLLIWETAEHVQSLPQVGPLDVPEAGTNPVSYILDGQQRLSTLYGVLRIAAHFPRGPKQRDWQWWIYYDLDARRFVHAPNGTTDDKYMPLRALLKTTDFLKESRRIEAKFAEKDASVLIDEAESLAQRMKSYKLAPIRIQGGTLEQAVEIFSRLNTTGQKMTPDQMASALTYREGQGAFDLARRIDDILERLEAFHFGKLRRIVIFRAIVATADFDVYSTASEDLAKKLRDKLPETVDTAEAAMLKAAEFLFDVLRVPGVQILPYSLQFLLLTEFFRCCSTPSTDQIVTLRKWFWATSFSGWFAGANSTQIREALKEFRDLAAGTLSDLQVMRLDERCRPFPQTFDIRSARLRALLLVMMQRLQPRRLDGEDLQSGPLLWEHGNRAFLYVFRRAPDEVLSSPANRILLPPSRGQIVRKDLLDVPSEARGAVLASHGIDEHAYAALAFNDPTAFIAARARHLAQMERTFMTELGLTLPVEEFGDADIDTEDD